MSLAVEVFSNYVRATQRQVVNIVPLAKSTQNTLKLAEVRLNQVLSDTQLPVLLKQESEGEEPHQTLNPYSIMQEIARAVYIEDVLFGKLGSPQRTEVSPNLLMFDRL